MARFDDFIGREFGTFTVVRMAATSKRAEMRRWRLECRGCGGVRVSTGASLYRHGVKCARCSAQYKRSRAFAPGDIIGSFRVNRAVETNRAGRVVYEVTCERCGTTERRVSSRLVDPDRNGCAKCGSSSTPAKVAEVREWYSALEARMATAFPRSYGQGRIGRNGVAMLRAATSAKFLPMGLSNVQVAMGMGVAATTVLRIARGWSLEAVAESIAESEGVPVAEAAALLNGTGSEAPCAPATSDRDMYERTVAAIARVASRTDREEAWVRYCRRTWPASWQRQVMQMPRAIEAAGVPA